MELETNKRLCHECRAAFTADRVLLGQHPFFDNGTVSGCPHCFAVDSIHYACDEPGCWEEATCGWPAKDWAATKTYRHTCGRHMKD